MPEKKSGSSTSRRRFNQEFKRQAVRLITEQKSSFRAAAEALGVNDGLLRRWHQAFAAAQELGGAEATLEPLCGENARLRQPLKRVELERETRGIRNRTCGGGSIQVRPHKLFGLS